MGERNNALFMLLAGVPAPSERERNDEFDLPSLLHDVGYIYMGS